MEKLKFGLIGLGEIAYKSTGKIFRTTNKAEMIAGMDPVEHVTRSYQEEYGIPCSTNLNDILDNPKVDAVIISTPHNTHASLGIKAAEAGKHVIVEKPMATEMKDADALIQACKENGVLCSSKEAGIYYHSAGIKAREFVKKGAIGDIMAFHVFGAANKPPSYWTGGYSGRVQTTWRKSKNAAGGGLLIMNYIYDICRIRFLSGLDVSRVYGEYDVFRTDAEVEDFFSLTLRLENGALAVISGSSCIPGADASGIRGTKYEGISMFGTEGQMRFEKDCLRVYTEREVDGLKRGEWTNMPFPEATGNNSFLHYIDNFAEAVLKGRSPDYPAEEEGRKNLEIILAAYKSGEIRKPIDLPLKY